MQEIRKQLKWVCMQLQVQKELYKTPYEKHMASLGEKICEIKSGGQEMVLYMFVIFCKILYSTKSS